MKTPQECIQWIEFITSGPFGMRPNAEDMNFFNAMKYYISEYDKEYSESIKSDSNVEYPCRYCSVSVRQSCCGCDEWKQWKEQHPKFDGISRKVVINGSQTVAEFIETLKIYPQDLPIRIGHDKGAEIWINDEYYDCDPARPDAWTISAVVVE